MVEACADAAEAACERLRMQHQQQQQWPTPIPTAVSLMLTAPPPHSTHPSSFPHLSHRTSFILDSFLALDHPQRLLLLLLLSRDDALRSSVQQVLETLSGWGAFGMGLAFEGYDDMMDKMGQQQQQRQQQQQQQQQQHIILPMSSEDYFSEVFAACGDTERVKQVI